MQKSIKHLVVIICAFMAYYTWLTRLFYFLNRNVIRVITFHNIIPSTELPGNIRIGIVDTENDLKNIISEVTKTLSPSKYKITFDDGYLNQYEIAQPILSKYGLKGTIFISGQNISNTNPMNALTIDLLLHWTFLAPNGKYSIMLGNSEYEILCSDNNRDTIWQKYIWPAYNNDVNNKGEEVFRQLDSQYSLKRILEACSQEYVRLRLTGLSKLEINNAIENGWEIGWHTYSHFPLSKLDDREQFEEIFKSPESFKSTAMSFPYGETQSVNKTNIKSAEKAGYPTAYSNLPYPNELTCHYFLPRFTLSPNKYLLHFELSGLKYFLKSRRLLNNWV